MQPGATPGTKQAPPTSLSHGMHGTERKVWYLAHGMAGGHGWRGSSSTQQQRQQTALMSAPIERRSARGRVADKPPVQGSRHLALLDWLAWDGDGLTGDRGMGGWMGRPDAVEGAPSRASAEWRASRAAAAGQGTGKLGTWPTKWRTPITYPTGFWVLHTPRSARRSLLGRAM